MKWLGFSRILLGGLGGVQHGELRRVAQLTHGLCRASKRRNQANEMRRMLRSHEKMSFQRHVVKNRFAYIIYVYICNIIQYITYIYIHINMMDMEVPMQGCFVPEHDRRGGVGHGEPPRCRYVFDCGNEGPGAMILKTLKEDDNMSKKPRCFTRVLHVFYRCFTSFLHDMMIVILSAF